MTFFNNLLNHLQSKNHKSVYLSLMRVLFGVFLLKETLQVLPYSDIVYRTNSSFKFNVHSGFKVMGIDIIFLQNNYYLIISLFIASIVAFTVGFGKRYTAVLVFLFILLLQKMNNSFVNGGDKMTRLFAFFFIFADSYNFLSYKKTKASEQPSLSNVISNLAAYSFMLQLCFAYFVTFINKISNPYWANGTAMHYVFNTWAFEGTSINKAIGNNSFLVYTLTYFTLLFEASFPFLIWIKQCRFFLVIGGLMLHLGIYFFMMLYNLQIIFLMSYGLFFSNDEVRNFIGKKLKLQFLSNILKAN